MLLEVAAGLVFGLCFNASLLRDADTWWLLGLGRWICANHHLPVSDPFSYTMAMQTERGYLPHQWLAAVVFYLTYNAGAIQALLMLSVGILFGAFVVLPFNELRKTTSLWFAIILTVLGVCAAKFHFLTRPEVFSYLFESMLLLCLTRHRIEIEESGLASASKLKPRFVALVFAIFIVWVNFHSGFLFGALILVSYCAASLFIAGLRRRTDFIDRSVLVATSLLPVAVCINPFGIRLLNYLANQMWFDPLKNSIAEMFPITATNPNFFPFFILIIVFIALCSLTPRQSVAMKKNNILIMSSLCVVVPQVALAFVHRRFVLFAVLAILFESAVILNRWRENSSETASMRLFDAVQWLSAIAPVLAIPLAFAWFGRDNRWDVNALRVVDQGVEYVKDHAGDRHIFNDFVLGNRLIWLAPEHPRVFLDTRYDMYGKEIVDEYDAISMGQPDWRKLLDKYRIEVVCFFKRSRIADLLNDEPGWMRVYVDERTVVFERKIDK